MIPISQVANKIFDTVILQYHVKDEVEQAIENPYNLDSIEFLLFRKCWIDTVQWHVEDLVRDPDIKPSSGLNYKRQIDKLNQQRTDTVEQIDDFYLAFFEYVVPQPHAGLNTESPAWAIDRLSILALKIYHMNQETLRSDLSKETLQACKQKLTILIEQRSDLSQAIDELLTAIASGEKQMKVYRQMKMYNDPNLNPILYNKNKPPQSDFE